MIAAPPGIDMAVVEQLRRKPIPLGMEPVRMRPATSTGRKFATKWTTGDHLRIVFISELDANCSVFRCDIPGQALRRRGHEVIHHNIYKPWPDECFLADVVIVQRATTEMAIRNIMLLQKEGVPVIAECDDLFLDNALDPSNPAFNIFHPKLVEPAFLEYLKSTLMRLPGESDESIHNRAIRKYVESEQKPVNNRREILLTTIRCSDAFTTTTPLLADAYKNPHTAVLPNCWDDRNGWLWNEMREYRRDQEPDETWILFSGSFTHLKDVGVSISAIRQIVRENPKVRFAVGGDYRLIDELLQIGEGDFAGQFVYLGSKPFHEYPRLLAQADIILAPLAQTRFNHAKSDIRLMEAGLLSRPFVASHTPEYDAWGQGGVFVDNKHRDWVRAIQRLVDASPAERRAIAETSHAKALGRSIDASIHRWEDVYEATIRRVRDRRDRAAVTSDDRVATAA